MVDFSKYIEPDTKSDTFTKISKLGDELAEGEARVDYLERKLAEAKKRVQDISERDLPELMKEAGVQGFTTEGGITFKVVDQVHANIAKSNHFKAMKWLEENGHGSLATRNVIVSFSKEQEEDAALLTKALGMKYEEVDKFTKVHSSTLRKWAREMLEAGEDVPFDLFGIHVVRKAKIG